MTVTKLLKKYQSLAKTSEYIDINTVINDLWQIKRWQQILRIPKKDR